VERVSAIFKEAQDRCRIADQPSASTSVVIFVGHGRSQLWRDLKDHLQDKHGYTIEAYETGARSGHCIRDILEEMAPIRLCYSTPRHPACHSGAALV
jgi:hypothetical protein